jgi:alkane 1-monooxygenase
MSTFDNNTQFESWVATAGAYFPYLLFVLFAISWRVGGLAWILPGSLVLLVVPTLDLFLGESYVSLSDNQLNLFQRFLLKFAPFGFVVGNAVAILMTAAEFRHQTEIEQSLAVFSIGVMGSIGITAAHELIHKRDLLSKTFGRLGLLNVSYSHFEINHIEGHHVNYGTSKDQSTAWRGEHLYAFVLRTVPGCLKLSWALEANRLKRRGKPIFSFHNRMLVFIALELALVGTIAKFAGVLALSFYFFQAFVAVFMLETVAYIKHYGLLREPRQSSTTLPHSWDAYFRISNYLEFQLQRHADHHALPRRPHFELQTSSTAARLPWGYPVMITLAMIPPVWHKVMDPLLDQQSVVTEMH